MHPLAFAPGSRDAGPPQVGQMAGDFGLGHPEGLDQKADANFIVAHEVKKPEPRTVGKSPEKQLLPSALFFLNPHESTPSPRHPYIC